VATVASEAPEASEMDIDEAVDESMMSQATVKPKGAKRGPKPKGKKAKKEDADLQSDMDLDTNEPSQPEPAKPKRAGRPKKRVSEEMAKDDFDPVTRAEPGSSVEPPSKRRARGTRGSSVSQTYKHESQDHSMLDTASVADSQEDEPKKTRKGSKKGTTKSRKASEVSVTSKSTSKARMPRDSELEAEIEAGLEVDYPELVEPEPEPEAEPELELQHEPEPEPEKTRASKKTKAGKKSKAGGKAPEPPQEDPVDYTDIQEEQPEVPTESAVVEVADEEEAPAPKTKSSKSSKKKVTKKAKKQETVQEEEQELEKDKAGESERDEPEHHDSFVSVEIIKPEAEPQPEPEVEQPAEKPVKKKSSKKEDKPKKSKKTKKVEASPPPPAPQPIEDELGFASSPRDEEDYGTPDDLPDQIQVAPSPRVPSPEPQQIHERTPVPPKTAKRFSDIPQEEHLAQSLAESHSSRSNERRDSQRGRTSNGAVSPLPVPHQSTPSLSPQSSDAENRPPSSLPSAKRPIVVASPPKEKIIRTPLAANTPSPSKRNLNAGFPASAHPWTPVDIDEVLFGEASDKENADLVGLLNGAKASLTSPEKRMTVEEWIRWNAKNGEERLKRECERLVSQFEKEGDRAMRRLETIECID
jgi:hypothetical protein